MDFSCTYQKCTFCTRPKLFCIPRYNLDEKSYIHLSYLGKCDKNSVTRWWNKELTKFFEQLPQKAASHSSQYSKIAIFQISTNILDYFCNIFVVTKNFQNSTNLVTVDTKKFSWFAKNLWHKITAWKCEWYFSDDFTSNLEQSIVPI